MDCVKTIIEIICVIFQCIILYKQYKLEKKIDEKSSEEEKGIFLIDKTNINNENKIFNYKYDLSKELSFHNRGNGFVVVKGISINEYYHETNYNTLFTNLDDYSKLLIDLNLPKEKLEEPKLKFNITIELENLKGYKYNEIIEIEFEKDENGKFYNETFFNIKII